MSEWITDRRPTADDADEMGYVLACTMGAAVETAHWCDVMNRPWMPLPAPPACVPPRTREKLVQDLLDAIDAYEEAEDYETWKCVMQAREELK